MCNLQSCIPCFIGDLFILYVVFNNQTLKCRIPFIDLLRLIDVIAMQATVILE